MKDTYPNMTYNGRSKYGYLEFDSYKFSENEMMQGEEVKMEIYKKIAIHGFSQIIPKLSEQYMLMQPIVDSTRNFAKKMIAELEKEFNKEGGWVVKPGNITSLNRLEPLNIHHQSWGEDTFTISIEAEKSLLRGLYFGIRKKSPNVKFDEVQGENVYQLLTEKLSGGRSSPWWILWKSFEQYVNTVTGEPYYLRTGSYAYENEQSENEAIGYIVSQLLILKEQRDHLAKLAHAKIS
jgi:hypothetical protein